MVKERMTDTHVYFVGGKFSQWAKSYFTQTFIEARDQKFEFTSAEQYMMASKANFFEDFAMREQIMATNDPKKQKQFGRKVKNFNAEKWDFAARDVVLSGNMAKFSQNEDFYDHLMATEDRILVEGAIYDKIWGVALAWDDPAIEDENNWRGTNWLGEVLMIVRNNLRG